MIKLMKSTFYQEKKAKQALAGFILRSSILSMNRQCQLFEKNFSRKQKRKFSVLVSSGSAANLALLQALLNLGRIKKGDRVGFSSLTWATNVMPIIQLGLVPVALDCSLKTLNVPPGVFEQEAKNISVLFLTNALGFCDNIEAIKKIARKNKVIFLEDNCESLGTVINNQLLGNFGLASTFSFFVGHHLSTVEGGMICTDDKELYHMLIKVRAHGWDRNLPKKCQAQLRQKHKLDPFYSKYAFYDLSFNFRPTEITGFLGNSQLKYWDKIVKTRERNFRKFHEVIKSNDDFISLAVDHIDFIANFAMPVVCRNKKIADQYKKKFMDAGVEIRPIIAGDITLQPFYKKYVSGGKLCLSARYISENGFYFPNNPELSNKEIKLLSGLLKK